MQFDHDVRLNAESIDRQLFDSAAEEIFPTTPADDRRIPPSIDSYFILIFNHLQRIDIC